MKYRPSRRKGYIAPARRLKAFKLRHQTLDVFTLGERERAALLAVYHFSSTRRFRYGLNERYIPDPSVLESLMEKGLVFYKRAHGHRYWLLTKKGRETVESLP